MNNAGDGLNNLKIIAREMLKNEIYIIHCWRRCDSVEVVALLESKWFNDNIF